MGTPNVTPHVHAVFVGCWSLVSSEPADQRCGRDLGSVGNTATRLMVQARTCNLK